MNGTAANVTLTAGGTAIAHLAEPGPVCRVDATIFCETARSFIDSSFWPDLERVFFHGLRRPPGGSGVQPAPGRFLLIVGHTDQVGSRRSNAALSVRRASAALAVFSLDASVWEGLYQAEGWGDPEIQVMSTAVDASPSPALTSQYQQDAAARLDLMLRYLRWLRPDWLPPAGAPVNPAFVTSPAPPILGCDFQHPRRNRPGTAVRENRRVDFFFFDRADPGVSDCSAYPSWRAVCGQFITVQLEVLDEYLNPYVGPFDLTLPTGGVLSGERTQADGTWSRGGLPAGPYVLDVDGRELTELPSGTISESLFEKHLDAADSQMRVVAIDPDHWFIRKANPASTIPQRTRGNVVEPLVDGEETMREMHRAFTGTSSTGHYIYLTAWQQNANFRMLGPAAAGSEINPVLVGRINPPGAAPSAGVDVRALLWDTTATTQNTAEQREIDDETRTPRRGEAILDGLHLFPGSHHQKSAAVRGATRLEAFCGGIDPADGRWDTPAHRVAAPWHDVHTRIRGPAAADVETNFRERWNFHPERVQNSRTPVPVHPTPAPISNGSHLVQTLRTLPPRMGRRYPFAPRGELHIREAYLRAIRNAREFIYIEDQFLVSDEVSRALARVLPSLNGRVIVVIPRRTQEFPGSFHAHRFDFIQQVRRVDPTKIEVYHLETLPRGREIFVHAKLMIVDDIWAVIGSANINRRSLTHDSELDVAVIDGSLAAGRRKFARELRIRLWMEHLRLGRSAVENPLSGSPTAIEQWARVAGAHTGFVEQYPWRPRGSALPIWDGTIDPDGR